MRIIGYTNKHNADLPTVSEFLPCASQRRSRIWEDALPICVRLGPGTEKPCRRPDKCPHYETKEGQERSRQ